VPQHALIVAGRGSYEDPWHDHAGTSHSIALLLADEGLSTTVRGLFPDAVDDLESFDLFIVNAGQGRAGRIPTSTATTGPGRPCMSASSPMRTTAARYS